MNICKMKQTDIRTVNPNTLVERNDIAFSNNAPREQRIAEYVTKLKNPYCYKIDGTVVKVTFADCSETIDDRLEAYARSMYNR
ncbi:MAG: hypothetical protein LUG52_03025 [Clostridia bacterium]|nr:hypothetical protein [Clostridia bacterium]